MADLEEHLFDTREAMAHALAADVAERLTTAAAERGAASLVGSGGTTPGPVYDLLAKADAPWDKVVVTATDERWASPDDAASNQKLIADRLLQGWAATARYVSLLSDHADPHDPAAEAEVGARIAAMPRPFDVVIAGMGPDGHAVSWFPGLPGMDASVLDAGAPALVRGVGPVPGAAGAPTRMTLTLAALHDARRLILLFTGEEKLAVLRRAQEEGPIADMPVRALLRAERAPIALYWAP